MVQEDVLMDDEGTPQPISPVHHVPGCNEKELQPDHPDYLLCKEVKDCMQLIKDRAKLPASQRVARDAVIEERVSGIDMGPLDIEPIKKQMAGLEQRRQIMQRSVKKISNSIVENENEDPVALVNRSEKFQAMGRDLEQLNNNIKAAEKEMAEVLQRRIVLFGDEERATIRLKNIKSWIRTDRTLKDKQGGMILPKRRIILKTSNVQPPKEPLKLPSLNPSADENRINIPAGSSSAPPKRRIILRTPNVNTPKSVPAKRTCDDGKQATSGVKKPKTVEFDPTVPEYYPRGPRRNYLENARNVAAFGELASQLPTLNAEGQYEV